MKLKIGIILTLVALTTLAAYWNFQKKPQTAGPSTIKLSFEELERAETVAEQHQGLMHRTDLCTDCGMIFVFDDQSPRAFWMKNTPTSLDMIFIRSDGTISEIHQSTTPNTETTYDSNGPIQYVLEAPAGYVQRHQLRVNQQLDIQNLLSRAK